TAHRLLAGVASALLLATPAWAQDAESGAGTPVEDVATDGATSGATDPAGEDLNGGDPIVATINGAPIHMSEVLRAIEAMPEQYRQLPVEMLIPVMAEQVGLARL